MRYVVVPDELMKVAMAWNLRNYSWQMPESVVAGFVQEILRWVNENPELVPFETKEK